MSTGQSPAVRQTAEQVAQERRDVLSGREAVRRWNGLGLGRSADRPNRDLSKVGDRAK